MNFLENDLEDLIYNASKTEKGRELLMQRGLPLTGIMHRQFSLGAYGITDLIDITISSNAIYYTIYELKLGKLHPDHLMQLCRYMRGLRDHIKNQHPPEFSYFEINGILIGNEMPLKGDFPYLVDTMPKLDVYEYNFDLENGLKFTPQYGFHRPEKRSLDTEKLHTGLFSSINEHKEFKKLLEPNE